MNRVSVKPALPRWARERSGRSIHELRRRFPKFDAWEKRGDRLEIVWGPDDQDRYDYCVFKRGERRLFFCVIADDHGLPVKDMSEEVNAFNVGEGFRNVGIRKVAPLTQQ